MESITANEAKTHFGSLLLKAQASPVGINKNGKAVAVMISAEEFENINALKLELLKLRAASIDETQTIDGAHFMKQLLAGDLD
ncbi:type II toxin-antitoxin system Phd/YefM family antitoxin [Alkalimonas mucilaginosa]|uniref:Antitoxin n=1 Tax=Alkalimonas mucilaginosa TaxID=3057676 RepID=A0ABU7JCJ7_9GAMM|nr:type II toxin-antitoxin system Phd/YefM family antitoxin [Alkalimonas sp. MEB004]MEE2023166.1 type II toxin-antitoxin system Phd/YefM family antitoxin [Alkalimonas sp. MEB004]